MTIDIRELPQRIDEAIAHSLAGVEVVIVDGAAPKVKLVPVEGVTSSAPLLEARVAGLHPSAFVIADDFDEPLELVESKKLRYLESLDDRFQRSSVGDSCKPDDSFPHHFRLS